MCLKLALCITMLFMRTCERLSSGRGFSPWDQGKGGL